MIRKLLCPAALALALAACGGNSAGGGDPGDDASARGEVLGGTISDSMIPLDELKSRSPPLKPTPSAQGSASADPAEPEATDAEGEQAPPATATDDTTPELPED